MGQLRTLSASRETQLLSEVAALRRFVVEQTKTYLSAMAEKTGKTAQLEAQCESLVATATNLGQKIESVGEALSGKCDAVTLTELSAQLDQARHTRAHTHVHVPGPVPVPVPVLVPMPAPGGTAQVARWHRACDCPRSIPSCHSIASRCVHS
eukprot:1310973-Prymnesium_polylepis.1